MSENTDDISVLFPGREIVAQGEKIALRPFYFGELPVVVKLVYPILSASGLSRLIRVVKTDDSKKQFDFKVTIPENLIDILMAAFSDASEPVIELLSFAIGKDRGWFNTLDIDEGVALTQAWFEVNRDFFVRRVLPRILPLLSQNSSAGLTSSQSLSSTGTDAQTSMPTQ